MFRGTPRERVAALARQSLAAQAPAGSAIVCRGERVPGLMVVVEGLAKLALKGDSERVLRFVGAGETLVRRRSSLVSRCRSTLLQ
jgi:CRP-like cAMP-binding protein